MPRKVLLSLIAVAIFVIPSASVAYVWFFDHNPDRVDAAIRTIGFYPITPPNLLRNPGTIYHITRDGRWTSALCEADRARLDQVMRKSDTEATVSEELRKASFGIGGKLAEFAQSSSDAEILQRVSFVFKKVQVLEVSIEELANIANELQKRAACQAAVLEYLSAGEYVCQVQQVLLASANYSVRNNASAGGSSTIDTEVLHAAIKANIDPKARVESDTTIAGDGLYYGMKFAPRCLSLLGQRPRRLPTKWHERLRSYVGLFT